MSSNILDEIVAERKKRIAQYGYTLGYTIPAKRERPIVPFIPHKGVILEVKRASPSKGDIAPTLDAAVTAAAYAKAGATAISVLTEEKYFKGSLNDLIAVAKQVTIAVLRKDFLIAPEEVTIAYNCGADAVLLIARILDTETMIAMAQECQNKGITALVELRVSEDLKKLKAVMQHVSSHTIVCGVNARDLTDFSIDLLTPAGLITEIQTIVGQDARIIFESGIRTPLAASFAGSLGFTGMLLGEAAARNPQKATDLVSHFINATQTPASSFWLTYAAKVRAKRKELQNTPFIKICGITNPEDACIAAQSGADFIGCIFCKKSPRNVAEPAVREIRNALQNLACPPKLIAVITDMDSPESKTALALQQEGIIDCIQLHGKKAYQAFFATELYKTVPHYPVVSIATPQDADAIQELRLRGEPRILIDAKVGNTIGGTGTQIDKDIVDSIRHKTKLWLAGGITPDNVAEILQTVQPELIDIASGVESSPGKKDADKIKKICQQCLKSR